MLIYETIVNSNHVGLTDLPNNLENDCVNTFNT